MDTKRHRGWGPEFLAIAFLASAASLGVAGHLAFATPDFSTRVALALPFALLALPVAGQRLDSFVLRAAAGAGASPLAITRRLVLPLCAPFILACWLLAAAWIALPIMQGAALGVIAWSLFVLLVLTTYAGLLPYATVRTPD